MAEEKRDQSDSPLPCPHPARKTGLFGPEHGCRCEECDQAVREAEKVVADG